MGLSSVGALSGPQEGWEWSLIMNCGLGRKDTEGRQAEVHGKGAGSMDYCSRGTGGKKGGEVREVSQ